MKNESNQDLSKNGPLILDIDGTLLLTDLLRENLWAALAKSFFVTLWVVLTTIRHPARLKRKLRMIAMPDVGLLPVRASVLDLAREALSSGRRVILTSGSDQILVDSLAEHLKFPGEHYGSNGEINLTGNTKAGFLVEKFGIEGFDYAGNAYPDLKVWSQAQTVIVVSPGRKLSSRIAALGKPVQTIGNAWKLSSLIKEMRPHQWVKSLLLLLPLLASHYTSIESYLSVFIAILAFCAAASAVYLTNDMLDLEADRKHPEKRHRPIASGALPIDIAMLASIALGFVAFLIAWSISWEVFGLIVIYFAISLTYSLKLKSLLWIDLFVLATLYTLRVLTGAVAAGLGLNAWLAVFVFAAFVSLAGAKRLTGLARALNDGRLPGRGYSRVDMIGLRNISVVGVLSAVGVYLAYSFSPQAQVLYSNLIALRLAVIPVVLWMLRMIWLSELGKEDYDPIVFVFHDKLGFAIVTTGFAMVLFAV